MYYDQSEYTVRCEWGQRGVEVLAPISDVVVIVDVLSFTTCVDVATSRRATVYPYGFRDESAKDYAGSKDALLAGSRTDPQSKYSLSPVSLNAIATGARVVLPSPNGSTLTLATGATPTLAGCLRNCRAVAACARRLGTAITVIPCGERWEDYSLRPAIEDLIGAGAIISFLQGDKSPEAQIAQTAFEKAHSDLAGTIFPCSSGKELIQRGFQKDVEMSIQLDVSQTAPLLQDQAYIDQNRNIRET